MCTTNLVKPIVFALTTVAFASYANTDNNGNAEQTSDRHKPVSAKEYKQPKRNRQIELGPRPFYLVNAMDESLLKNKLLSCQNNRFYKTDFSIGHRGAPLQFPEHTKESYRAAANMGAGIIECDVTFTKDRELVCRHSQCDLHKTTNILAIPALAAKCNTPFTPANPSTGTPASANCCTSDITLAEFKSLCGKMDAADPYATTVEQYMDATDNWRTDLYASCGTLLSHKESIDLFKQLDVKYTPELKSASTTMPYEGDYTQQHYARQMIDEYKQSRVNPSDVWVQSFNIDDIKYWIDNEPEFGKQAVFLDNRAYTDSTFAASLEDMKELAAAGIRIIAPPMWVLLDVNSNNEIIASDYARNAKAAGLDIITWTLERSGLLKDGGGWHYQSVAEAINNDGDVYTVLDVLAKDVGIIGIFSDWPATVTYYANCMGLK